MEFGNEVKSDDEQMDISKKVREIMKYYEAALTILRASFNVFNIMWMALQMFEWISIIAVIKFESSLNIEEYENNLQKSKEARQELNRRENCIWNAFRLILGFYFVMMFSVKLSGAFSIVDANLMDGNNFLAELD